MKFNIGASEWPGLSKLAEEAGEALQVVGKIIGADGSRNHWDGSNLYDRLAEEVADLMAACEFVAKHNKIDGPALRQRIAHKLALFEKWHADELDKEQGR